jgi:predicted DNA binding CopG/RHH family protein
MPDGNLDEIQFNLTTELTMNDITQYNTGEVQYHAIKFRTSFGYETILLTDHDMKRCRERASKHDLSFERYSLLRRIWLAVLLVIYG